VSRGGPGVRVIGGELKGQRLAVGAGVRPTEGRVREALFSIWQERVAGARLLDLFAGSGAVAIEALSRGARSAVCVEADREALRVLERNRDLLPPGVLTVRRARLPAGLAALASLGPFDLVFADPPYRWAEHDRLVAALAPLLAPGGEAAIEHSARLPSPAAAPGLVLADQRRYGESALAFYRPA
jgi:16S rRNA (guanine(966)-N(2))-methyltransferase RsmD